MASMLKFDSERREMRRERHQARVARKRERQQARQLKHAHQDDVVRVPRVTVGPPTPRPVVDAAPPTPITLAEPEVAPTNPISVAESDVAPESQRPLTDGPEAGECKPFVAQRERDVAAFRTRREAVIAAARAEAQDRIERIGEERAVADALGALAHSDAAPWRRHRDRVAEAISTGRIPVVGACARRACRGAASDAARTSRRASDPELALAVAVAYAVIAQAPWSAVRGARAERAGAPSPTGAGWRRAFWR